MACEHLSNMSRGQITCTSISYSRGALNTVTLEIFMCDDFREFCDHYYTRKLIFVNTFAQYYNM